MTIDDLFHSVVRGHRAVIALCILLPMVAVAVLVGAQGQQWDASVRMQVASQAPTSATQAEGLSSRVFALATTPALLSKAMRDADVTGSVDTMAKTVSVERLGESPIVRLTIRGADARHTGRLVTALADRVSTFMNHGDRVRFDAVLAEVDMRISDAQSTHAKLLARLDKTVGIFARTSIKFSLRQVGDTMSQLAGERSDLLVSDTIRDHTALIGGSTPDVQLVPSTLLPKLALAGIFGIVLGLTVAAAIELARPRLRGARAVAGALHAPVVGTSRQQPSVLASSMALAARRRGVETVVLVPADAHSQQATLHLLTAIRKLTSVPNEHPNKVPQPVPDDSGTASSLSYSTQSGSESGSAETVTMEPYGTVRFTGLGDLRRDDELSAGIVVVTSGPLLRRGLDEMEDLVGVVRWPLLGVFDGADHHGRSA